MITSDAVHFAEHLITDRAPDNDVGLSSFDTAAPDGAMLTKSVKDFSVITHRTMRRRDRNAGYQEVADELVAICRIATTDHPEGIWCPAECLLENNNKGYEIVREYLLSYAESHKNALYPVFETASWTHDGTTAARRGTPKKQKRSMDCIVIGIDLECRDDNDIRIATKHDGQDTAHWRYASQRPRLSVCPSP